MSENDNQPQELKDEVENYISQNCCPKIIPMMSSKEKLKCQKIPLVLQNHVPSKERYPEEYTHRKLFIYFPFRDKRNSNTSIAILTN